MSKDSTAWISIGGILDVFFIVADSADEVIQGFYSHVALLSSGTVLILLVSWS